MYDFLSHNFNCQQFVDFVVLTLAITSISNNIIDIYYSINVNQINKMYIKWWLYPYTFEFRLGIRMKPNLNHGAWLINRDIFILLFSCGLCVVSCFFNAFVSRCIAFHEYDVHDLMYSSVAATTRLLHIGSTSTSTNSNIVALHSIWTWLFFHIW